MVKSTQDIYLDARKKVRELHTTPTPNHFYISAVMSRPVMCIVGIQTDPPKAPDKHTEPTPPVQPNPTYITQTQVPTPWLILLLSQPRKRNTARLIKKKKNK